MHSTFSFSDPSVELVIPHSPNYCIDKPLLITKIWSLDFIIKVKHLKLIFFAGHVYIYNIWVYTEPSSCLEVFYIKFYIVKQKWAYRYIVFHIKVHFNLWSCCKWTNYEYGPEYKDKVSSLFWKSFRGYEFCNHPFHERCIIFFVFFLCDLLYNVILLIIIILNWSKFLNFRKFTESFRKKCSSAAKNCIFFTAT